jgi:hypothetical protein
MNTGELSATIPEAVPLLFWIVPASSLRGLFEAPHSCAKGLDQCNGRVHAGGLWGREHPGRLVAAAQFFVENLKDHYAEVGLHAREWLEAAIEALEAELGRSSGDRALEIRRAIDSFQKNMVHGRVNTAWCIDLLTDDDELSEGDVDDDDDMDIGSY